MDTYTMKEVERLVRDGMLSHEVLHSIFESTTRRIEIYADNESLEILKYLKGCSIVPDDVRVEIEKFLLSYDKYSSVIEEDFDIKDNKTAIFYIIIGIIFIAIGIIMYFIGG